tara:strand:+ start:464 stop:748 length:285 start_codon:yes stop_codon:yes gene_type:complete
MKIEVKEMNEIPLNKQLKYALQARDALREEYRDWDNLSALQQKELSDDLNRACDEVAELQFIIDEASKIEAAEELLRQQEWMNTMELAYEENYF